MSDVLRVAVVVVAYNSAQHLPALLASLPDGLTGVEGQLVVVDNDSQDDGAAVVGRLAPEATVLLTGRNGGYAAGVNAGVAAASPHDAVLVLNPDVELEPGCVRALADALELPDVGIAVPRLQDGQARLIRSLRREPTLLRALGDTLLGTERAGRHPALGEFVSDPRSYDEAADAEWAQGSVQLVGADCWDAVGPWDESFFLYSEEVDFDLRARDAGFRVRFVPTARATHVQGASKTSPGLRRLVVMNRLRLFRRRNGWWPTVGFWAVCVLREASRTLLGRPASPAALSALLSPRRWRETPGPGSLTGRR